MSPLMVDTSSENTGKNRNTLPEYYSHITKGHMFTHDHIMTK
jgi:hypothetical protein